MAVGVNIEKIANNSQSLPMPESIDSCIAAPTAKNSRNLCSIKPENLILILILTSIESPARN